MKTSTISSEQLLEGQHRLKPNFYLNEGKIRLERMRKSKYPMSTIGQEVMAVYRSNIFKRQFVADKSNGLLYISGADITTSAPRTGAKLISKKYTPNIVETTLKENQILVTCAGTVGKVRLVTSDMVGIIGSQDIIRVDFDNDKYPYGYVYAFLASSTAYIYMQSLFYGSVVPRIEPFHVRSIPIPALPSSEQNEIHELIKKSSALRVEATTLLKDAHETLMASCNLPELTSSDYEYFGANPAVRKPSTFQVRKVESTSLAAWNYSGRIAKIRARVQENVDTLTLANCLLDNRFFSTGSFKRLELDSPHSIELINQSDIFDNRVQGRRLARKYAGNQRLVEYGEVLIAGVGTLGENETFCRALYAGEELTGKLISGEFIRMKANGKVPAGYLYAWLASDYGFRLIRGTQAGTKLCRPIPKLLAEIPVPVLKEELMNEIDQLVTSAHAKRYAALQLENEAIHRVESAIAAWQ